MPHAAEFRAQFDEAMREAELEEFFRNTGELIDGRVSRELLVALFLPSAENTLHDGAAVIKNLRVQRAGGRASASPPDGSVRRRRAGRTKCGRTTSCSTIAPTASSSSA